VKSITEESVRNGLNSILTKGQQARKSALFPVEVNERGSVVCLLSAGGAAPFIFSGAALDPTCLGQAVMLHSCGSEMIKVPCGAWSSVAINRDGVSMLRRHWCLTPTLVIETKDAR
jgi:hypothetical protein